MLETILGDTIPFTTTEVQSDTDAGRKKCAHILNGTGFNVDYKQFRKHTKGEVFMDDEKKPKLVGGHLKGEIAPGITFRKHGSTKDGLEVGMMSCAYGGKKINSESTMFPKGWTMSVLEKKLKHQIVKKRKSGYFGREARKAEHNEVCRTTIPLDDKSHGKIWCELIYRPQILDSKLLGIEITSVYPKNKD